MSTYIEDMALVGIIVSAVPLLTPRSTHEDIRRAVLAVQNGPERCHERAIDSIVSKVRSDGAS